MFSFPETTDEKPSVSRSILYIDDDADDRLLVKLIAQRALGRSTTVHGIGDVSAAYRLLGEHSFDLVIVDNRIGDGRARETVAKIADRLGDARVAIVSDYVEEIDEDALPASIDCVLPKHDMHRLFDPGWLF
ncbi:MAG: response regulator [Pseudomonadota bacterium]